MDTVRSKTSASDQTDFHKRFCPRHLLFFSLVGDSAISILTIGKVFLYRIDYCSSRPTNSRKISVYVIMPMSLS